VVWSPWWNQLKLIRNPETPFERLDLTKNLNKTYPAGIPILQAMFRTTLLDRGPYTQRWLEPYVLFRPCLELPLHAAKHRGLDDLGKGLSMFRVDSNLISGRTERLLREGVSWLAVDNSLISATPGALLDYIESFLAWAR
jgi:hypothetical protein